VVSDLETAAAEARGALDAATHGQRDALRKDTNCLSHLSQAQALRARALWQEVSHLEAEATAAQAANDAAQATLQAANSGVATGATKAAKCVPAHSAFFLRFATLAHV
jgi:hypothetical protein